MGTTFSKTFSVTDVVEATAVAPVACVNPGASSSSSEQSISMTFPAMLASLNFLARTSSKLSVAATRISSSSSTSAVSSSRI